VTLIVNRAGGGLIGLPDHGWALAASIVIYAVAMDFSEYAFHRAQHAIPFLWRMHSLHHSEPHYNATTALRSFWLEPYLKSISVWLVVGIVFKTSSAIATGYFVLTFYNYIIHANARIHYGPLSWLLNTPAYHRIHHSALPEHSDCNYAAIFPIFDVLFGAYRPPPPGVYPPTGLVQDAPPVTLLQALAWPLERAQRSATGG
jgi:sterol desaturase/sphingolipid hydroxylase (fatty acid hydroxylase superfamily)